MKTSIQFIFTILLLTSCSTNDCKTRFEFISCNDSIPILNLDLTTHPDAIRKELNELYGFDLCDKCTWAEFRLPFTIEGQNGYLKVRTDFDSPVCGNCPIPMRKRHHFSIMINQRDQLLVEGEMIELDSLQAKVANYLASVGNDDMAPETFKQVNFRLFWNQESNTEFLHDVLTVLYKSHLAFVESKLAEDGIALCNMEKERIDGLKEQYPLRIEFDLGRVDRMGPLEVGEIEMGEEIELENFERK